MSPTIIQSKQYGCVQMLLVQIGLALYVIVIFLAQNGDGTITPKVLKMQKVAEANQTRIESTPQSHALLGSGNALEAQIIALIAAPKPEIGQVPSPASISATEANLFTYESTDLNSLGSKPRAPSVIA